MGHDDVQAQATVPMLSTARQSLRERLEFKRRVLQEELDVVREVLALLNDNPAFEKFHDAVVRAGY